MRKKLPKSINLIETIHAPGDTFTIFYDWTFTIGKYLLIFVQIIVIVVFVVRLTVDKINNDLTNEINGQVDLLLQADVRENELKYRNFQILLKDLDHLEENHVKNARRIVSVLDSIPNNIVLESFSYNGDRVTMNFNSTSLDYIKNYENFLENSPEYSGIKTSLEKIRDDYFEFDVSYLIIRSEDE